MRIFGIDNEFEMCLHENAHFMIFIDCFIFFLVLLSHYIKCDWSRNFIFRSWALAATIFVFCTPSWARPTARPLRGPSFIWREIIGLELLWTAKNVRYFDIFCNVSSMRGVGIQIERNFIRAYYKVAGVFLIIY